MVHALGMFRLLSGVLFNFLLLLLLFFFFFLPSKCHFHFWFMVPFTSLFLCRNKIFAQFLPVLPSTCTNQHRIYFSDDRWQQNGDIQATG